jgi:PAS domain S-box-containing protein
MDNIIVMATDLKGIICSFNRGAEKWLGYSHSEIVGQKPLITRDAGEVLEDIQNLCAKLGKPVARTDYLYYLGLIVEVGDWRVVELMP